MEDVMLNIMYDIPSETGVKTCEITADTINKIAPPHLIREGDPQPKLPAARKTRTKAATPAVKKAE
jgi:ATP-dependent protease Clp ATPase subunit